MRAIAVSSWPRLPVLLLAALVGVAPPPAFAEDPPAGAAIPAAFVEIATIEHRRRGAAALDPHLVETADPAVRRRAITALGRIGTDDDAVVPRLRALVQRGGPDLELALWAAGISGQKTLVATVIAALDEKKHSVAERVAAIEALGMLADTRADGFLIPHLDDRDAAVRAAAGYALSRAGSDRALDALCLRAGEREPEARRAIAAGIWRCAGLWKRARAKKDEPWTGSPLAAAATAPLAKDPDPETRLFALRALNALWPKTVTGPQVGPATADPDPRVVADFLFRLLANEHEGPGVLEAVKAGLRHADPLVRETAAESAGKAGGEPFASALREALEQETDARVREQIAIAAAACGDDDTAAKVLAREDRPKDHSAREATRARVLLASKKPESHAAAVAMLRDPSTPVPALGALLDGFAKVDAPGLEAAIRDALAQPDPVVRGAAAGLVGEKKLAALAPDLERIAAPPQFAAAVGGERDARQGALEGLLALDAARLAGIENELEREAHALARGATWHSLLRREPSASVRRALLEKLASTGLAKQMSLPEAARFADLPAGDWAGLPRPKAPILGLDLTQGTGPLSEEEVLRLAARIAERRALLVVTTEGLGVTAYRLDAEDAPVHAASVVIAATSGVYDGTPWHRVVPAFVIQGADPRGDGSGDAGWLLPDEITRRPFRRGALGMPKGVKDTGGCQLFAMHAYAPHLDGRYSAYGEAVSGAEVIDRIRVGDRILTVRVAEPPSGK